METTDKTTTKDTGSLLQNQLYLVMCVVIVCAVENKIDIGYKQKPPDKCDRTGFFSL